MAQKLKKAPQSKKPINRLVVITRLFNKYLNYLWLKSAEQNNRILISRINRANFAKVLDIGCDSGKLIIERVQNIRKPEIYGIDIRSEAVSSSRKLGIRTKKGNAEKGLPFHSNFFDIVSANQIIEHLVNVDRFASEIYRVLKPNGYLILSTENLSSWHNIFALILGWQAFSQHISQIKNIGNPFRLSNWEDIPAYYTHVKIFTPKGLKDLFKTHNFQIIDFFGASYYPFPPPLSSILGKIDPRHSPFIGIKARKPEVPK
ncbi:MAG: type 11 methyltransferase [uncultured bacterium]|nr:MAG: type 11 methyltransferase [uncultured bacterium]KKR58358.1 MAG: Methyltransferase type 11 [Candidatus Curtissbacteria bacterium GW2011_GWB1_40_28]KKR77791.1 MAG: Methyltransferase type 11 [Candidatus Curtissbacteria bacterium GW2011_GWD1_40_8]KKS01446.1 MAG: Methyltransferase type 11 [Candidatus Curtissbacteria bacterium GW2011_GWC2_41_21]